MGPLVSGGAPGLEADNYGADSPILRKHNLGVADVTVERGKSRTGLKTLVVRAAARLPGEGGPRGHVKAGSVTLSCALGRSGVTRAKREGDGATPVAAMRILHGYYRPDRFARLFCRVPLSALPRNLGWCDAPDSPLYNRPGNVSMRAGHETMWRDDRLYDVVFVLDWNIKPRRAGRGSAIFLHCAKPGLPPTQGCVALRPDDMRRLLPRLIRCSKVVVR